MDVELKGIGHALLFEHSAPQFAAPGTVRCPLSAYRGKPAEVLSLQNLLGIATDWHRSSARWGPAGYLAALLVRSTSGSIGTRSVAQDLNGMRKAFFRATAVIPGEHLNGPMRMTWWPCDVSLEAKAVIVKQSWRSLACVRLLKSRSLHTCAIRLPPRPWVSAIGEASFRRRPQDRRAGAGRSRRRRYEVEACTRQFANRRHVLRSDGSPQSSRRAGCPCLLPARSGCLSDRLK